MIFALGGILESIDKAQLTEGRSAVFLADSSHMREAMELAGIVYEGEISLSDVGFCKLEAQQECLAGSFCIPKFLDMLGSRYRILFFINRRHIVIIDDADFSARLILRIQRRMVRQGQTREHFLYNFITQFLTVISTIFFPLTLITGWYGMNFENMPELESGYPFVIILSFVVIIICIWIFRKKKIL